MKKVLVIDDSKTILNALNHELLNTVENIEVLLASSFLEANKIIRSNKKDIFVAIVDLNLPDCKDGDAVLLTSSHHIPTVVLTGIENETLKTLLLKKNVLDYVLKGSDNKSINYVAGFVKKIIRNHHTTALVVDDSKLFRKAFRDDLQKLHINVIEANDGEEALEIMDSSEEKISLILTDFNMPKVDGVELTIKLREKYEKDTLSIIALSASEDEYILSDFIKAGANDFITKPHKFTELSVRVNSNLDILDLFQKTKDLANKDYLTGSYNRRYFFEAGKAIVDKNIRKDKEIAVATLDIDHFKRVNDTYGHDVGDLAIQEIAVILNKSLRVSDLVARFGGEEYCILLEDISIEDTQLLFEKIRSNFEENKIKIKDLSIKYTVSLGIAYCKNKDLDEMLKISDEALYEAKETGRNKVVIHRV